MDTEVLHSLLFKDPYSLKKLLFGKSVFGISGVVHNAVGHPEHAARIVAEAHGLRELPAEDLLQERNVRDVIEIDDRAEFRGKRVFFSRRVVGGEHDVSPVRPRGVREHQFCHGGAVESEIIVIKDLHDIGIGRRLDGKILTESGIP